MIKKNKRIASGIMIGSTIAGTGIYLHNKKKKIHCSLREPPLNSNINL